MAFDAVFKQYSNINLKIGHLENSGTAAGKYAALCVYFNVGLRTGY